MACRSMTVDLSLLRPRWKRQRVFGIDCSRSWRQADSMLIGRWTARSMRPPKRFVHSRPIPMSRQRRCASRSKRRRLVGRLAPVPPAMRCGSLGRPMRKPFYGLGWTPARGGLCRRARATCARRGTPSMLVPSSCRLGQSSIFWGRIAGAMFIGMNSRCAHHRPVRVVLGRRHVWLPVPDRSGGHEALKRLPWGLLWPTMFEQVLKRTAPDLELL